jgi:WD40 repeat protein
MRLMAIGFAATALHVHQAESRAQQQAIQPDVGQRATAKPKGLLAEIGSPRLQHGREVNALRFSLDGKRLYSASADFTARIWDVATGDELRTFATDTGNVRDIALTADEQTLLMATDDEGVLAWNTASGKRVRQLGEGDIGALALAADGLTLFSAGPRSVQCWDLEAGREKAQLESVDASVARLVVSGDGALLAGLSESKVYLWKIETGKLQHALVSDDALSSLALSPDGSLAVAANSSGTVLLWDVESGKLQREVVPGDWPPWRSMALSRDGEFIFTGGEDGQLRALEWKNSRQRFLVQAQLGPVACLAISPDGKTIATGGSRGERIWDHSIHLWDAERGVELPQSKRPTGDVPSVLAVSADGKRVVKGCFHNRLTVWGVPDNKLLREIQVPDAYSRVPVALSPDGQRIAAGGGQHVKLFSVESGEKLAELQATAEPGSGMCFTPDGTQLAIGTTPGSLVIWNIAGSQMQRIVQAHEGEIWTLDCSPDGKSIATGGFDGAVAVWSIDGRLRYRHKAHESLVRSVKFSADGMRLASAANDHHVIVWETATGKIVRNFDTGWSLSSIDFCLRDRVLIAGHHYDRIDLLDIATGRTLETLRPRPGPQTSAVVVGPQGRWLWTADSDEVVRKWDLPVWLEQVPPPAGVDLAEAEFERQWRLLGDADPAVANDALWKLAGDASLKLLREKLISILPEAPQEISHQELQQLIGELDDDSFQVREAATRKLISLGTRILPTLEQELKRAEAVEVRLRLRTAIKQASDVDPIDNVTPEDLRLARAAQLLAYQNTPASRDVLRLLLRANPRWLSARQAKAALARMEASPPGAEAVEGEGK